MNIVLGDVSKDLATRHVVLPLDTFHVTGHAQPVTSFCVIESVPMDELRLLDNWRDLHEKLISNYHKKNWDFCQQALEHLIGRWNGELDSFYLDLGQRISRYQEQDPGPDWSGIIQR